MIDDFRPVLQDEALQTARQDVAGLEAVGVEFETAVAPGMAEALGLTPGEFNQFVQNDFPAVATGVQSLPEITTTFSGLIDMLDSQQELFASADAIPTANLPATTVPWSLLAAGIIAVIAGGLLLLPGRGFAIAATVLGVLLIAVPLLLSLTSKASDADALNANLEPVYTAELIDESNGALATVGAMGNQMQTEMLPALAEQMQMTPDQLNAFLGENFPATAAGLQALPTSMERFEGFVGIFANNLDNYETINPVSFEPIIWMVIIGGIVITLAGGYCLIIRH